MARPLRLLVPLAGGVLAAAAVLAGCGTDGDYANLPRPPSPIVVTNQTDSAQQIIFESAGGEGGFTQRSGPINPRGTAELKAEVPQGRAVVRVSGKGIDESKLTVGPRRRTGQDDLLQP
jgi:hypothetical protein